MKLQLDTTKKIIKLESDIKLSELVKNLEKLLPKGEWKEFTLETNTYINNWSSPTVIRQYPIRKQYPWYPEISYYNSSNSRDTTEQFIGEINISNKLESGLFNIEFKEGI